MKKIIISAILVIISTLLNTFLGPIIIFNGIVRETGEVLNTYTKAFYYYQTLPHTKYINIVCFAILLYCIVSVFLYKFQNIISGLNEISKEQPIQSDNTTFKSN